MKEIVLVGLGAGLAYLLLHKKESAPAAQTTQMMRIGGVGAADLKDFTPPVPTSPAYTEANGSATSNTGSGGNILTTLLGNPNPNL